MPRLPDRQIAAATAVIKKNTAEITAKQAIIKGAQAQFAKFDAEAKAQATLAEKLKGQVKAAEAAVKKAAPDKKAIAAAQKTLDQLEKALDAAIAQATRAQKLRALAEEAPEKAQAAIKKLQADLDAAQKDLADAQKRKPAYDKALDGAIELRTDFITYAKKQLGEAANLAKQYAKQADPKIQAAARKLRDAVAAQLKPIREPAKMGLDPADMAAELVPRTNECFKVNTAILTTLKPVG